MLNFTVVYLTQLSSELTTLFSKSKLIYALLKSKEILKKQTKTFYSILDQTPILFGTTAYGAPKILFSVP